MIDEDITVEATPGHTAQDITLYVNTNSHGRVAVCGKTFNIMIVYLIFLGLLSMA